MSSRRKRRLLARAVVGMAAAAASAVVLVGQFGRTHHTLDQFNSLLSMLVPVLALCLAAALGLRDRAATAVAAVGLLVGSYQLGGAALVAMGRDGGGRAAGTVIKVLTLSTYHANPDPAAIAAVIEAQAPDIAVLQETNGTAASVIGTVLAGYRRIRSCDLSGPCTLTILSRWPVRPVRITWPSHQAHPDLLVVEVAAPFGSFRMTDVHLARPYVKSAQRLLQDTAGLARRDAGQPLIVAGDFNTATGTFGLARFAQTSGLRRHDGFIPTYPANTPWPAFAGIDHVFASRHWQRIGCRRSEAGNSDHYGVVCRMRLRAGR